MSKAHYIFVSQGSSANFLPVRIFRTIQQEIRRFVFIFTFQTPTLLGEETGDCSDLRPTYSRQCPLWYTFGVQGYREQSQEAEGVPWRAGEEEEQSTYMFFGRTGRFKKAEILFGCRLFGDIVGSSARGHKCRHRGKKRLPWRRDPRIPPALPLSAASTSVAERRRKFSEPSNKRSLSLFLHFKPHTAGRKRGNRAIAVPYGLLILAKCPFWYTFGVQVNNRSRKQRVCHGVLGKRAEHKYMFFGRTGRFRKTEILFSCRIIREHRWLKHAETKCRYREKRLPWRRFRCLPRVLPFHKNDESLASIRAREIKEEPLLFFSVFLTRGFSFIYLFIYVEDRCRRT
ncbi:hypothetical protein CEXT_171731 [Caerostris extrusa]|uniref:Uncharacterized protein n=1 Tax=Caerostris extrusa TaxID=172846 RepID=A0AAV4V5P3_CAEEX|nr:hypothetical protein CEXT_171731 [Caerostris extrusa]